MSQESGGALLNGGEASAQLTSQMGNGATVMGIGFDGSAKMSGRGTEQLNDPVGQTPLAHIHSKDASSIFAVQTNNRGL